MKNDDYVSYEDYKNVVNSRQNTTAFRAAKIRPAENYYTSKPYGSVKLRDSLGVDVTPDTVPIILQNAATKYSDRPALASMENGRWNYVTFSDYYTIVKTVAKAFVKLGLQRYHSVCILASNSKEWFYSCLAATIAGGIASGIYCSNSSEACLHCLNLSRANIVVVENEKQLEKILQIKDRTLYLKSIVLLKGKSDASFVYNWSDVLNIGEEIPDDDIEQLMTNAAANECCTILFTSGTTGIPKAVMLSHDNLIFKMKMTEKCVQNVVNNCERRIMSYLPMSHVAAQIDLYKSLLCGACVYFADENALKNTIIENLRAVRPTEFIGVPRIWEKIKDRIEKYLNDSVEQSERIYQFGNISFRGYDLELLCTKVKELIGLENCELFICGAAPISFELKQYLARFGIFLKEYYGMTETSGGHIIVPEVKSNVICAGGKSIPGAKWKIYPCDDNNTGELLLYGRNIFMGYVNEPEITRNSFDDSGYFRTGDIAENVCDGSIRITGRLKDLIITTGGENIAPALIEFQVQRELPVVSHAVLIGEGKKYLSLLVTLKCVKDPFTGLPTEELAPETKRWCQSLKCNYENVDEILQHKPVEIYNAIQNGINRVNAKAISTAQRIQKFIILPREFSLATGELGPTSKLRRFAVYKKYEREIEKMYSFSD